MRTLLLILVCAGTVRGEPPQAPKPRREPPQAPVAKAAPSLLEFDLRALTLPFEGGQAVTTSVTSAQGAAPIGAGSLDTASVQTATSTNARTVMRSGGTTMGLTAVYGADCPPGRT